MPFLILLMLALLGAACNGGELQPTADSERAEDEPPAVYERRLVFLAVEQEPPLSAVLDFAVAAGAHELHRSARGWIREMEGWHDFVDLSWRMEPMRDPWRVMPHGALRLTVGDDADIEAVIHHGEPELRLMPGPDVAAWVPHSGGQLRLRPSRLRLGGREITGMLLDAQFVHRTAGTAAPGPGGTGDEIFLTDGRGLHFVMAGNGRTEPFAWMQRGQEERTWNDAEVEWLEPAQFGSADGTTAETPASWRIYAREGGYHGELESLDVHVKRADAGTGTMPLVAVFAVHGWIDLVGERRQVFGVVRHAQE